MNIWVADAVEQHFVIRFQVLLFKWDCLAFVFVTLQVGHFNPFIRDFQGTEVLKQGLINSPVHASDYNLVASMS